MTNDPASQRVAKLAPRQSEFEARVRQIAADSAKVKWSFHARDRMRERDIPIRAALNVIREGVVDGEIVAGNKAGEWKAKFVRSVKGRRAVGVVVLTIQGGMLLVKTVEWEDIR